MALNNEELSTDYEDKEFATKYCELLSKVTAEEDSMEHYSIIGKLLAPGKLKGTRYLDFGCGPTVHRMAIASSQFEDIVLAEYSEDNRRQVEKWLKKDPDALDWTPIMKIMAKVAGYSDLDKGVEELESRIRQTVKSVVPCDLKADKILPDNIGEFDVVSAFYCLESCCFSDNEYKEGVKKLGEYIKKGGALIMEAAINCTYYTSHRKLKSYPLTEDLIKDALKEAGFVIKDWFSRGKFTQDVQCDFDGLVYFSAIKQ